MSLREKPVAVIPARGGSKRIPRKNIRKFNGMPMIGLTIEKLHTSRLFESVYVTTDDEEIAETAKKFGAQVPFRRESSLADDITPTVPVVRDAIRRLNLLSSPHLPLVCVYPCVPLLKTDTLASAIAMLSDQEQRFIFPIVAFESAPQRALRLSGNSRVAPASPEYASTRTQDLEELYYDCGQFYCATVQAWLAEDNIHLNGRGIKVDRASAVDIDTESDWKYAEQIHSLQLGD